MKKNAAISKLMLIALLTALAVTLFACDRQEPVYTVNYDEGAYSALERGYFDGVTAIDIEWLFGEVYITADDSVQSVYVSEKGATDRGEALTARICCEDGALSIKCAAPGSYKHDARLVKTLYVTLPEDICAENIRVTGNDADVYVRGGAMFLNAAIDTHRGAIVMDTSAANMQTYPRSIELNTRSGDVWLNVSHPVTAGADEKGGRVAVFTTDGNVDVKINALVPLLRIKTSSGQQNIDLNAAVLELQIDTLSGAVELNAKMSPLIMNVEAEYSLMTFKLNGDDAFELVTNAQLAVSMVDISKREPMEDGNFKYVYAPADYTGLSRASYTVHGKNSVLHLEKLKV